MAFFFLRVFMSSTTRRAFLNITMALFGLSRYLAIANVNNLRAAFFPRSSSMIIFQFGLLRRITNAFNRPFLTFILTMNVRRKGRNVSGRRISKNITRNFQANKQKFTRGMIHRPMGKNASARRITRFFRHENRRRLKRRTLKAIMRIDRLNSTCIQGITQARTRRLPSGIFKKL